MPGKLVQMQVPGVARILGTCVYAQVIPPPGDLRSALPSPSAPYTGWGVLTPYAALTAGMLGTEVGRRWPPSSLAALTGIHVTATVPFPQR